MDWWKYLQGLGGGMAGYNSGASGFGGGQSLPNWWAGQQAQPRSGGASQVNWNPLTQRAPFGGQAQNSNPVNYNSSLFQKSAPNSNPVKYDSGLFGKGDGLRAGGAAGPEQTQPLNANAGVGGQGGGQIAVTPLDRGHKTLDERLGDGWSASFAQKHGGMSPIQFYGNAFQQIQDPEQRMGAAINAAINDANFQPGAVAEWQKIHGNTPIPEEQWQKWWWQAQNGGANFGQGAGINPWNVY